MYNQQEKARFSNEQVSIKFYEAYELAGSKFDSRVTMSIKVDMQVKCDYCGKTEHIDEIFIEDGRIVFCEDNQYVLHVDQRGYIYHDGDFDPDCVVTQYCQDEDCYDDLDIDTRVLIDGQYYCPSCAAKLQNK